MDKVNTRVNESRNLDIRKWIQREGFDTKFLVELASQADETTASLVTDSSEASSLEEQSPPEPVVKTIPTRLEPTEDEPTSTSTPVPPTPAATNEWPLNDEVVTGLMDEIRQMTITVSDLKAENESMASKIKLRELEHKDLVKLVDELQQGQDKTDEKVEKAFRLIYKTG